MVARIWEGFTTFENAEAYATFLKTEFMPDVEKKNIIGYKKFQLLRNDEAEEVHFITIMWFENIEQIKQFAGENFEKAVVHPTALALLKRYHHYAKHFDLIHELNY